MVAESQKPPMRISSTNPVIPLGGIRSPIVMLHNTSDNCACASDNAHNRR